MTEPVRLVYLLPESTDAGADGKLILRWPGNADPFAATAPIEENPAQATVQVVPRAFSPAECARIAALGDAGTKLAGQVTKGAEYRDSEITWIEPSGASHWLYHRIGLLFLQANRAYRFALAGMAEPLQYARYKSGGHLGWHADLGIRGTGGRKLSLTIQVTDPAEYEGGDLEFVSIHGKGSARDAGTAIIFPAYLGHRVTTVTRGLRCALVAWAYGSSFR